MLGRKKVTHTNHELYCNASEKSKSPLKIIPGPDNSRFGEGEGELSSTFDLTHPLPIQTLNVLRNVTAFTAATAQLPKVSISP